MQDFTTQTMTIAPDKIGFFRFILEAYDNLAVLSTLDEKAGLVVLRYPPEAASEVATLLAALEPQLASSPCPAPQAHEF